MNIRELAAKATELIRSGEAEYSPYFGGCQPYEVAAWLGLDDYRDDDEVSDSDAATYLADLRGD